MLSYINVRDSLEKKKISKSPTSSYLLHFFRCYFFSFMRVSCTRSKSSHGDVNISLSGRNYNAYNNDWYIDTVNGKTLKGCNRSTDIIVQTFVTALPWERETLPSLWFHDSILKMESEKTKLPRQGWRSPKGAHFSNQPNPGQTHDRALASGFTSLPPNGTCMTKEICFFHLWDKPVAIIIMWFAINL